MSIVGISVVIGDFSTCALITTIKGLFIVLVWALFCGWAHWVPPTRACHSTLFTVTMGCCCNFFLSFRGGSIISLKHLGRVSLNVPIWSISNFWVLASSIFRTDDSLSLLDTFPFANISKLRLLWQRLMSCTCSWIICRLARWLELAQVHYSLPWPVAETRQLNILLLACASLAFSIFNKMWFSFFLLSFMK